MLSILAGAAALAMFDRLARRLLPTTAARWAALLFAVDFLLIRYQRYGLAESIQILLILATVTVWLRPDRRGRILCGLLLAGAMLQKPTSLHVIPALVWIDARGGRRVPPGPEPRAAARSIATILVPYIVAGGMLACTYGALWLCWPDRFADAWALYARMPFDLTDLPRSLVIVALGTPLAVVGSLWAIATWRVTRDRNTALLLAWIIFGCLTLLACPIHPVRYLAALIPPAILLGALALDAWLDALANRMGRVNRPEAGADRLGRGAALVITGSAAIAFLGYYVVLDQRDGTGIAVARWLRTHARPACTILGPPQFGVDIPNPYIEMTSLTDQRLSAAVLREAEVCYVLYDDVEWRSLSDRRGLAVRDSLQALCRLEVRVGAAEIWRCAAGGAAPPFRREESTRRQARARLVLPVRRETDSWSRRRSS
jgi:hypothetical protein